LLALRESLRQAVGETAMDYIIAALASVGLFVYLVYALLRAEKF
jgi:K+-transporting ATPase KdpF subunit